MRLVVRRLTLFCHTNEPATGPTWLRGSIFTIVRSRLPRFSFKSARVKISACVAFSLLSLIAWPRGAAAQATSAAEPTTPPRSVVLRIHGSNTIGAELMSMLLIEFLRGEGWQGVRKFPSADADVYRVGGVPPGVDEAVAVEVEARGSTTAFTSLASGGCDIGMSSRRIKESEVIALRALGDMNSPACERVIALDGLAVIVNRANSLNSLDRKQIADLFAGRVRDWSALGVSGLGAVRLHARDAKSGTFDTFKSLVLGDSALAGEARRHEDSRELSAAVAGDPSAIGFVGLPFVGSARALPISDGEGSALAPTSFTVRTEDYPLSRRLYLYTAAAAGSPLSPKFLRFAEGEAGQAIVARAGFIDQTAAPAGRQTIAASQASPSPAAAPRVRTDYERLVSGAERVGLTLRFRSNETELDPKATADLDRLVRLLAQPEFRTSAVVLLGFSDNRGDTEVNRRVSDERARAVAGMLRQRGMRAVNAHGLGSASPVASNETNDGREKNRRVEVWLKRG